MGELQLPPGYEDATAVTAVSLPPGYEDAKPAQAPSSPPGFLSRLNSRVAGDIKAAGNPLDFVHDAAQEMAKRWRKPYVPGEGLKEIWQNVKKTYSDPANVIGDLATMLAMEGAGLHGEEPEAARPPTPEPSPEAPSTSWLKPAIEEMNASPEAQATLAKMDKAARDQATLMRMDAAAKGQADQMRNLSLPKGYEDAKSVGVPGPGAANVLDPAFDQAREYGRLADKLNTLDFTFKDVRAARNKNSWFGAKLDPKVKGQISDLLGEYFENPHFKTLADELRVWVHSGSGGIAEGSRLVTGMDPITAIGADWKRLKDLQDLAEGGKQMPGGLRWPLMKTELLDGQETTKFMMEKQEAMEHAENLFTAIRESTPNEVPKYRGMSFDKDSELLGAFKKLRVGDEVKMPLQSFSTNEKVANSFSVGVDEAGWPHYPVKLKIEGPHHSINASPLNHYDEAEHLTAGIFEVQKVETPKGKSLTIHLKQTGVW